MVGMEGAGWGVSGGGDWMQGWEVDCPGRRRVLPLRGCRGRVGAPTEELDAGAGGGLLEHRVQWPVKGGEAGGSSARAW
jgi:hypothetical protein